MYPDPTCTDTAANTTITIGAIRTIWLLQFSTWDDTVALTKAGARVIVARVRVDVDECFRRGSVSDAEASVVLKTAPLDELPDAVRAMIVERLKLDKAGVCWLCGKDGEPLIVPAPTLAGIVEAVQADQERRRRKKD